MPEPTTNNGLSNGDDIPNPAAAAFIGGIVGGFAAILVIAAAIGCAVMLVRCQLCPSKACAQIPERENLQLDNAIYNSGEPFTLLHNIES